MVAERNGKVKKQVLIKSLFVLSMVFIMISVSFSWMNYHRDATVSGVQLTLETIDDLLIVGSGSEEWEKSLHMSFGEDFQMKPVCGDGRNFFTPILEQTDDSNDFVATGYTPITADPEENGIYTLDFACSMESSTPLYLGMRSSVTPAEESGNSAYGEYSAGYICAAMRIAVFQKVDDNYELKAIWIPNSTTEFVPLKAGSVKVGDGEVEESYTFVTDSSGTGTVTIDTGKAPSGQTEHNGVVYAWGDITRPLPIGFVQKEPASEFRLVMWIDGNDRECTNALMGGLVSVDLKIQAE